MAYATILKKTMLSQAFYLTELILQNISIIVQGIVTTFFGLYLNSQLQVFTGNEVFVYYLFSVGFINVFQRNNLIKAVERDISTGDFVSRLVRPVSFIMQYIVRDIGERLAKVWVYLLIVYLAICLFFGFFVPTLAQLGRAALILPVLLCFLYLHSAIWICVALFVERINSLARIYNMLGFFIGGGLASTAYFPPFVRYLPQQFFFNSPLEFITRGEFINFPVFLIYVVAFSIILAIMVRLARRRLDINGG